MKKLSLYIFLVLMWCNVGFTQTYFKLVSVYDYEVALEKAKTDKETSDKLQTYFVGLSDGMAWTDDLHKRENKKRIYCLGDKTANIFVIMSIVNKNIKNKNFTLAQKQIYPIGLLVADAMKTEFPCHKFKDLNQTASSTEINKAILKCADYEHTQDMKQNFFKYMILMVSENYSENEKEYILINESSNPLHKTIILTTGGGYSEQEIITYLKDKQEKGTSNFESLEEKDKHLVLSIRQNYDYWIESLNLFLRKSPVEKRKDNRYGIIFLTCESKAKKDADSFVEKYSNIN